MTARAITDLLHIGRAFVDSQRPDLTIEAFDDVAAADAVAAVELNGTIDDALGGSVAYSLAIAASRVTRAAPVSFAHAAR